MKKIALIPMIMIALLLGCESDPTEPEPTDPIRITSPADNSNVTGTVVVTTAPFARNCTATDLSPVTVTSHVDPEALLQPHISPMALAMPPFEMPASGTARAGRCCF